MPWMKQTDSQGMICIHKQSADGKPDGPPIGKCHATDADADAQLAALHANVKDAAAQETSSAPPGDADTALQEAATIKHQARAALKAARLLMANKALPKTVHDALGGLDAALLKTWADLGSEADGEATAAAEATGIDLAGDFIPLVEKAVRKDGTMLLKVIKPGWGSSGFYSSDVLKRCGPKAFPKGTQLFLDHQTEEEERKRPEGSVRDLVGHFVADARWMDHGPDGPALYAEAEAIPHRRPFLESVAPYVGASIRAKGKCHMGTAEGREGKIIEEISAGRSVDVVTMAGAGGKILDLTESAEGNILVLKEDESARRAVPDHTEVKTVNEEEAKKLQEANAALLTENAALKTENATLKGAALALQAKAFVDGELAKAELPAAAKTRLGESLVKAPVMKDGALDTEAYGAAISEAVRVEADYLKAVTPTAATSSAGRITGMGAGEQNAGSAQTAAQLKEAFKTHYHQLGMSDAEAEKMAEDAARG